MEIIALIKFSPKREKILGDTKTNIEEQPHVGGLLKFSPTRWTVRAIGFNCILCNYDAFLMTWEEFLDDQKLDSEICGRIIGVQAQMNLFFYFFWTHSWLQSVFLQ